MGNLRAFIGGLFDRRKRDKPVATDRRHRPSGIKDSDAHLKAAMEHLSETVRLTRKDFEPPKREIANDHQEQVQFVTFRDMCSFSGSKELAIRLCRHPKHEAANTGVATCEETVCPLLRPSTALEVA